jgi:hypothetical protein
MEPEWLTYAEVADRLGIHPEAARSRAKRSGWRRQAGNDGKARVLVALEPRPPGGRPMATRSNQAIDQANAATISALEAHVEILKEQLATAEARLAVAEAERGEAIAAFASLADRLDALAAERARPWWRRLTG